MSRKNDEVQGAPSGRARKEGYTGGHSTAFAYKIIDETAANTSMVPVESSAQIKHRKKNNRRVGDDTDRIRFSIGAKLITIISLLVIISLGSITALVSWLVREDLRVAAEEQNFEVNRRSALEAENLFSNIQSNAIVLMQVIQSAGKDSELAAITAKTFFDQNKNIAAMFSSLDSDHILLNEHLQLTLNEEMILRNAETAMSQSNFQNGTVLNMTPVFGEHILAIIFPWEKAAICVMFSPSVLSESLSFSLNKSYLVNGNNDILIYPEFEVVSCRAIASSIKRVISSL